MNIIAIIQARTGSTRLPNKIFLDLEGKTVLEHVVDRLRKAIHINNIVIATTHSINDDVIESFCLERNIDCYRGSEDDVLSRYYEAAMKYEADIIIRVTSDCPLIDPDLVDMTIATLIENKCDLAANVGIDPKNRTYPRGLDVEVFTKEKLAEAYQKGIQKYEREHVTPYIYNNTNKIVYVRNVIDYSRYRWTLDTVEDYELIKIIFKNVYTVHKYFTWNEVLDFMQSNPELSIINAQIEQKKIF